MDLVTKGVRMERKDWETLTQAGLEEFERHVTKYAGRLLTKIARGIAAQKTNLTDGGNSK